MWNMSLWLTGDSNWATYYDASWNGRNWTGSNVTNSRILQHKKMYFNNSYIDCWNVIASSTWSISFWLWLKSSWIWTNKGIFWKRRQSWEDRMNYLMYIEWWWALSFYFTSWWWSSYERWVASTETNATISDWKWHHYFITHTWGNNSAFKFYKDGKVLAWSWLNGWNWTPDTEADHLAVWCTFLNWWTDNFIQASDITNVIIQERLVPQNEVNQIFYSQYIQ